MVHVTCKSNFAFLWEDLGDFERLGNVDRVLLRQVVYWTNQWERLKEQDRDIGG